MISVDEVLSRLKVKARSDQLAGMARYGIVVEKRLGVSIPELRKIAKEIGKTMIWHSTCGRPESLTQ